MTVAHRIRVFALHQAAQHIAGVGDGDGVVAIGQVGEGVCAVFIGHCAVENVARVVAQHHGDASNAGIRASVLRTIAVQIQENGVADGVTAASIRSRTICIRVQRIAKISV